MKISLQSTHRMVQVNGAKCRIWEGFTESGIPVYAAIASVAVHRAEDQRQFEAELIEHQPSSDAAIQAYPLAMFLD